MQTTLEKTDDIRTCKAAIQPDSGAKNEYQKIFKTIDGLSDYVIDLQRNMTCRPAISPETGGKGEYQKAQYLESEIKKLKFDEYIRIDVPDARAEKGIRPNLVVKYHGIDKTKTLWLLAHTDTVPEGDLSLWKTNPFEMVLDKDGDTIYGRGVEDNQQAITAALVAARAIMESGKRPPVNLGIIMLADEELGSFLYGIKYIVDNHRDLFGKDDSFIVQDSGDPEGKKLEIAEKNVTWHKFTTIGAQAHASLPSEGNNAFVAGSALAVRLHEALPAKFNKKDTLFNYPFSSFEPTKKEANVPNVNTIPGSDIFYMDSRVLPCYDPKDVEAEIAKIVKSVEDEYKVKIKTELVIKLSSKATSADAPIVKRYAEAVEKVNGVKAELIGIGGSTFAAAIRNLGLSAVVAATTYEVPHTPNEKSSIKFTLSDAKIISYILMHMK